jgi:hypothetical protein
VLEEVVEPPSGPQVLGDGAQHQRGRGLSAVPAGVEQVHVNLVEALVAQEGAQLGGQHLGVVQVELAVDEALRQACLEHLHVA